MIHKNNKYHRQLFNPQSPTINTGLSFTLATPKVKAHPFTPLKTTAE